MSLLYPGNQTSQACLGSTVAAVERVWGLTSAQRQRTVLRLDGGFGTDANLNPAPSPPDAGRYTIPSRFKCQSEDCGYRVRGLCTGR